MLVNKHFVEELFAVLTGHIHDFLFFLVLLIFVLLFLLLLFLHGLDSSSEVLGCCLPILPSLSLIKALAPCHSHLFLFLKFGLLGNGCLCNNKVTCSLEILFASELNSFLLDINTNLQALACFSSAFRLNLRPQPSGHITRSF